MILVTGGLGFIGPHVARALLDAGEGCVLTRRESSRVPAFIADELGERLLIEQLDLVDEGGLLDLGRRHNITGIVHLAAGGFHGVSPLEYVSRSSQILFGVLDAAQRWGVKRVCLASTIGVYAGAVGAPGAIGEDTPIPLAATAALSIPTVKRSGELLASFVGAHSDLEVVNMRFSAIWGPLGRTRSPFFAAPALIHAAARGDAPDLLDRQQNGFAGDATDLCYVKDCARAVALLQTTARLHHATYNVAAGRATANAELLAAIADLEPDHSVTLPPGRDPSGPGHDMWLDISRLQNDTGYVPEYSAGRAAGDYVAWLKAGNDR
jgi:UDP-glucose 4-epimerase